VRVSASRVLRAVHGTARDLLRSGAVDEVGMRVHDPSCLPPAGRLEAAEIRRIGEADRASQAVFARYLGVGTSTVQQWEQGLKRPSGTALRLLELVERKGLAELVEGW
jgi:putative transcriptional regulator